MKSKLSILLILICFFTINVNALEVCEMSSAYEEWLSLSEEDRVFYSEPDYCASSYTTNANPSKSEFSDDYQDRSVLKNGERLTSSVNVSRYSAVDVGLVNTPENQYGTGSCWAFASNSLVETSALNEGLNSYNLSDRHMEYTLTKYAFTDKENSSGYNRQLDDGGNADMAASYYLRHNGPILESAMPYQTTNQKIHSSTMPNTKPVLMVSEYTSESFVNTVCSSDTIASIKSKILQYGSVGISIYMDESTYLNNGKFYYYDGTGSRGTNHAVVIVGWDDTISSSNFRFSPPRDGAFIVKNSWGTTFGDGGYFYMSYSDYRACTNLYTFSGISANDYSYAYEGADGLANYLFANGTTPFYVSAKFAKKGSETEYLDRISFEVTKGSSYTVYVSTQNNLTDQSTWTNVGSVTASFSGTKTVKFSPIVIAGEYTVIIKMTGSGNFIPLACRNTSNALKYYGIDITVGRNYYSVNNGVSWSDIAELTNSAYSGCEPVIYAYTKSANQQATTFNINSITPSKDKVYTFSDYYFTFSISSANVLSYEMFAMSILDESKNDVTNMFDISGSIQNGRVIIKLNKTAKAGKYYFRLKYNADYVESSFDIYSVLESSVYSIDEGNIIISLGSAKELRRSTFISKINTFGASYDIYNKDNGEVVDSNDYVGTMGKLVVSGVTYNIIVKGDINGDGMIMSNDSLLISRSLVNLTALNNYQKMAADVSNDNAIMSNDPLLISRFLVGMRTSL